MMTEPVSNKTQHPEDSTHSLPEDLSELQRHALDQAMKDALGQGRDPTIQGLQLWIFTRKALQQFGLYQRYSEAHVLITAYLRGIKAIASGKCIVSPYGWLRSAAYNYIRECHRTQQRTVEFKEWYQSVDLDHDDNSRYVSHENSTKLRSALQRLSPFEQKLIILKVAHDQSWKNIQKILEIEGLGTHKISTLRKQKSRAMMKLRKYYGAL